MSEFLDIAWLCRQLRGPDISIDAVLARATGWSQLCSPRWGVHAPHWYKDDHYIGEMIPGWIGGESAVLPPFTAVTVMVSVPVTTPPTPSLTV